MSVPLNSSAAASHGLPVEPVLNPAPIISMFRSYVQSADLMRFNQLFDNPKHVQIIKALHLGRSEFFQAAARGHIEALRILASRDLTDYLFSPFESQQSFLSRAFTDAVETGQLASMRYIYSLGLTLSIADLGDAVIMSSRKGYHDAVRFLLTLNDLPGEILGQALNLAAVEGHDRIVMDLVRFPAITLEDRHFALLSAIEGGHFRSVDALMNTIETIHQRNFEMLFLVAVRTGIPDILERLLRGGRRVSMSCQSSALTICRSPLMRQIVFSVPTCDRVLDLELVPGRIVDRELVVDFSDLKKRSWEYLHEVVQSGWPRRIQLSGMTESRAIDLGGVMKEFLSSLVQQIAIEAPLDSCQLPLLTLRADQEIERLRLLGAFYSMIHSENGARSEPLLTGDLLHPCYFSFLALVEQHREADKATQVKHAACWLKDRVDRRYRMPFDIASLGKSSSLRALLSDVYFRMMGLGSKEESLVEADLTVQAYIDAATAFLQGSSSELKRAILSSGDPEALLYQIQGESMSPEKVKKALKVADEPFRDDLILRIEWIKEKIDREHPNWSAAFFKLVTGKRSLIHETIKVRASRSGVFEVHTCFNSIDLPIQEFGADAASREAAKLEFWAALDGILVDPRYNIA